MCTWCDWNYFTVWLQTKAISKSHFQCLPFLFTWFGGVSPSAGGPHADPWVLLALIIHSMQNPVKFPGRFRSPLEKSAEESHLSLRLGTASSAPSLMAFCKNQ